jgi:D-amino-acid dehydrogenase
MATNPEIIVIGGGVVGASTAYHLALAGASTLLIDRHDTGRATDAGAGILAPEISTESGAWFDFAVHAVDYYPTLLQQLAQDEAGDTGYARCGLLRVAVDEDELAAYEQSEALILARQRQRNFPSEEDLRPISPEEARQLYPALGPVRRALYDRLGARVDGRLLCAAILRAAVRRQIQQLQGSVERLVIEQGRVKGVEVGGDLIEAKAVVIAGGAWSAAFAQQLGVQIPIEPQRGQIIHLDLAGTATGEWPIVNAFHGHYIVSWPGSNDAGRVVVGATRETGSGFVVRHSAAGIHEVLGEALRVAPGLAPAEVAEVRIGLRPRTPDNLPVLCYAPTAAGVVIAAGHGATGLQLGPFSGKIAAELALGQPASVDIRALHVNRFA